MNADDNLLFGMLALQADLIEPDQFIKACALWATRKEVGIGDLLVELAWITADDKTELDRLLEKRKRQRGALKAELAAVPEEIRRSLAALEDSEIQHSMAGLLVGGNTLPSTLDVAPGPDTRYDLKRLHATGGIGRVWLARDENLGRDVALKELRPERATDRALWARFLQEARITGQLEHPGIVPVYDVSSETDTAHPFYTMRFVEGRTLSQASAAYHRRRSEGKADSFGMVNLLSAFVTLCNTIAYAHSRGVLHRDLKGPNVILGNFGEVFVLDWGLAKLVDSEESPAPAAPLQLDHRGLSNRAATIDGQALGTPAYMAPEQAAGRVDLIDCRTDVYGLGAILYEILTGRPPLTGDNKQELLRKVQQEEPVPPRQRWTDVPVALEKVCLKALSKDRERRFSSPIELAHEVQYWQEAQRRRAEEERDRFFSLSFAMLCVADFDGYFKLLNPSWQKTLGWTVEELQSRPYIDFIHPDDRASTQEIAAMIGRGEKVITFENRYRCKDGSYKWLLWTGMPVVDQGVIFATAMDITGRKSTEEAVRDSEERYRSVVAVMQEGIVLMGADGEIRACNASAERILGLTRDEMIGRSLLDPRWETIHEDGTPFLSDEYPLIVTLRTGKPCVNVIMGVRKPDGELSWISVNSQPLIRPNEASPHAVVTSFQDVTRLKGTEEELKRTTEDLARCRQQLERR